MATRFIENDPQVLLNRDGLFSSEEVFVWKTKTRVDVEPWKSQGLTGGAPKQGAWPLETAGDDPWLERSTDFKAGEIHDLEVAVKGLPKGRIHLYWAGPGERFSPDRQLTEATPGGAKWARVRFPVAKDGQWRGTIDRLRLSLPKVESPIMLGAVRGLRREPEAEKLAAALTRGWKVDLSADVRNALLVVPGVPVERDLEMGSAQVLAVSYGLQEAVQQRVEFRVEAVLEEAVLKEGNAEVLFRATLDPEGGEAGVWHEASVDLAAYAGRRLQLRLVTDSHPVLDLARGFPVWANPEILDVRRPALRSEEELPNVLLISIDTLRADRLSSYGHHRKTSPNIDRWAETSAVLFRNTVAQAPWTLPSHASIFTGLEALRHDVNHAGGVPRSLEMLAESLRRKGYSTAAITGGGYLRPQFGFTQGFDVFDYWTEILAEQELAVGMEKALSWLDKNHGRRFFLFFHTYEVHYPHRRRQPYYRRLAADEPDLDSRGEIRMRARAWKVGDLAWNPDYFVVQPSDGDELENLTASEKAKVSVMYDSAISYVDVEIQRLFDRLAELDLKGRTLIILTSDHGEALGEKDRAGHNYLEDYNIMVPLVIEFPDGLGRGARIDDQVRTIDIVPTILDYLGMTPRRPLDGVSLLSLAAGKPSRVPKEAWTYASAANVGLALRYENQMKYVFNNAAWVKTLGEEKLFDLRRDPAEEHGHGSDHPLVDELRARVSTAMETQHQGPRLRIHNEGKGTLSGKLKGSWVHVARVKAAASSCRCIDWQPGKVAEFSLQSGEEMTLFFEAVPGHRVGIEGRFEVAGRPATTFDESFDLRRIKQPVGLAYSSTGWRRSSPVVEDPAVGFTLWRAGTGEVSVSSEPVSDDLRQQLEALGYVN